MTDKLDLLNSNLKDIKYSFDKLEKLGINRELLEIYIKHKTSLPRHSVRKMLDSTEEFFDEYLKKFVQERV